MWVRMRKAIALLFILVLTTSSMAIFLPVNALSSGWQASSTLIKGLPPLGRIGENSQCLVFNLTGKGRWDLIICPYNGWTANEYPFVGYYWDGSQWVNDNTIVNGLTADPGLNHPTVGFNVTGDNTFDMIVGGNPYMSSPGWSGYAWNGTRWVANPTILNGLPNYGWGNNFATLGYNLLGNGKWDLIVDNSGNHGYVGFEWNGNSWTPKDSLVDGLPMAESVGSSHKFPAPCLVSDFEGKTTLFVGLSSGGPLIGSMEAFQWNGAEWVQDLSLTYGVNDLLPWPNTPTVGYNVTGNNQWVLLIGSASGFVNQTDYYHGYYWTGRNPVSISPHSVTANSGQPVTFTATIAENAPPYTYQWYVNDRLMSSIVSFSNTNSWSFTPPTAYLPFYVFVKVTDSNGLSATSLKSEVTVILAETPLPIAPSGENSSIPSLFISSLRNSAYTNFTVEINGNLTEAGIGIAGEPILLSYSMDGGNSWNQFESLNTDNLGNFAIVWTPPAKSNYLLKAEYPGSPRYLKTSTIVNFEAVPSQEQQIFSIQTNSTLSAFSFSSTSNKINFSVSGPAGSTGYIRVYIPKMLIGNISDLRVYLDGENPSYITESVGNSWLISFNYYHSIHTVSIDLGSTSSQELSNELPNWGLPVLIVLLAAAATALGLAVHRKQRRKSTPKFARSELSAFKQNKLFRKRK